ncbi:hypothetical protein SAY87_028031 [Trapa incisa]|uniref:Remorin C-terminal domain-containing protein n=1 Tax=Trapa incisa TaxID=236973 RepID=A0AAN7QNG9_9MYRT|nr:hypothetical protein SAY87_028031 [Trapa incisa]
MRGEDKSRAMNRNGVPFSPGDDRKQLGGGGGPGGRGRGRGRGRAVGIHHHHHYHHQEPQKGWSSKGWSSERVASAAVVANRRHTITGIGAVAAGPPLSPFNSGRALPSKWEDAERWICSPFSVNDSSHLLRNRPKSKSGPLGGQSTNYFGYAGQYGSFYSPAVPGLEGWSGRGFFGTGSPFSTGVFVADETVMMSCVAENNNKAVNEWLGAQGEVDARVGAEDGVTRTISRRDMATQMSPKSSICSSPETRTSIHRSPPNAKLEEVRDVLMDRRSNAISWSKRHAARLKRKDRAGPKDSQDEFSSEIRASSSWDIRETAKNTSRADREEAKITAWENLQKAKAEAAIRKLEMKLEKKRSSSMDRILNKLRRAELKAQEMRSSISEAHLRDQPQHQHSQKEKKAPKHFGFNFGFSCFHCHSIS